VVPPCITGRRALRRAEAPHPGNIPRLSPEPRHCPPDHHEQQDVRDRGTGCGLGIPRSVYPGIYQEMYTHHVHPGTHSRRYTLPPGYIAGGTPYHPGYQRGAHTHPGLSTGCTYPTLVHSRRYTYHTQVHSRRYTYHTRVIHPRRYTHTRVIHPRRYTHTRE